MSRRRNDREIADEIDALLTIEENAAGLIRQARNSSDSGSRARYLAQAQRAIAKLDPTRHRRVINKLQSEVLALQGRRGDRVVAHLTPGEVVIPLQMQTPAVRAVLSAAAREAGIDLSRLVVGNGSNAINPDTGAPEFAFSAPEFDGALEPRGVPLGQQTADLHINYFPEDLPRSPGHIGIGVNNDQTQGFYPRANWRALSPFMTVPGEVRNDDLTHPHETLVIPTSKEQDEAAKAFIESRKSNPGNYDLYTRQCTDFGAGALRAGGQTVPSDGTPELLDDMRPKDFFSGLKQWYKP